MPRFPHFFVDRFDSVALNQQVEAVVRRNNVRLPLVVAALDGLAERQTFDIGADLGNVLNVFYRRRRDAKSALPFRGDEAADDEPRQRLAQRA